MEGCIGKEFDKENDIFKGLIVTRKRLVRRMAFCKEIEKG